MTNQLYIIIGAYGSGKSEYAVHFARQLHKQGLDVVLVDMDIVNPYFRTRDVKDVFEQEGIEVIAPEGQFRHADVPMLSPKIKGSIENQNKTVILDVGGDPAGCRALGRFSEEIKARGYQLLFVINTCRPFTTTPEEIIIMQEMLEFTSKLRVTELICNTNLMQFTTETIVKEGIDIIQKVSEQQAIPFKKYLVLDSYIDVVPEFLQGKSREIMIYTLMKPWESNQKGS
jgi:tRNA uridine 5-carbamoylmethylation protein Kti12